jgi:hypothetical protein
MTTSFMMFPFQVVRSTQALGFAAPRQKCPGSVPEKKRHGLGWLGPHPRHTRANDADRFAAGQTETARGWRTAPRSDRYLITSGPDFEQFETALTRWLEVEGG